MEEAIIASKLIRTKQHFRYEELISNSKVVLQEREYILNFPFHELNQLEKETALEIKYGVDRVRFIKLKHATYYTGRYCLNIKRKIKDFNQVRLLLMFHL